MKNEKINKVRDLTIYYFENSFLFDSDRLRLKKHDDEYKRFISAVDIYNEFIKIDKKLKKYADYSTNIMLKLIENLITERYKAFKNIYNLKYKTVPKTTTKKYITNFEKTLKKLMIKLEIGFYPKGFGKPEKEAVQKSLAETILYLRSIGKWKVADDVLEHYREPLAKPYTKKSFIAQQIKIHTNNMSNDCKITKKEAKKLLKISANKVLLKYENS